MPITHPFVSGKSDGGDATLVRPSNWNADHTGTLAQPIATGTSFPGGPSTSDLFYRTDRNLLYYYDGTRWLTVTLYEHHCHQVNGISATSDGWTATWEEDYDVWVVDFLVSMESSSLTGSAYWTASLYFKDGSTLGSAITSVNNLSGTNNSMTRKKSSVNALMGTAKDAILVEYTKTSTPGVLYAGAMLTYRLVG